MNESVSALRHPAIVAVIVAYESMGALERCITALREAAPRRGVRIIVVDNASADGSADLAERLLCAGDVLRLPENRGFAAGVNAGFSAAGAAPWLALVNPDVVVSPSSLDDLVDVLEREPRVGMVGPRCVTPAGAVERTVGAFPTPGREWVHSWLLHGLGLPGRLVKMPVRTADVEWLSGCGWVLRAQAAAEAGPLDDGYFMYYEDVDYCRRMCVAGWRVVHVPEVVWQHGVGRGSALTGMQPADGGAAALRYFAKHHPGTPQSHVRRMLLRGWRLRRAYRLIRAALGDSRSRGLARRYEASIAQVARH